MGICAGQHGCNRILWFTYFLSRLYCHISVTRNDQSLSLSLWFEDLLQCQFCTHSTQIDLPNIQSVITPVRNFWIYTMPSECSPDWNPEQPHRTSIGWQKLIVLHYCVCVLFLQGFVLEWLDDQHPEIEAFYPLRHHYWYHCCVRIPGRHHPSEFQGSTRLDLQDLNQNLFLQFHPQYSEQEQTPRVQVGWLAWYVKGQCWCFGVLLLPPGQACANITKCYFSLNPTQLDCLLEKKKLHCSHCSVVVCTWIGSLWKHV